MCKQDLSTLYVVQSVHCLRELYCLLFHLRLLQDGARAPHRALSAGTYMRCTSIIAFPGFQPSLLERNRVVTVGYVEARRHHVELLKRRTSQHRSTHSVSSFRSFCSLVGRPGSRFVSKAYRDIMWCVRRPLTVASANDTLPQGKLIGLLRNHSDYLAVTEAQAFNDVGRIG